MAKMSEKKDPPKSTVCENFEPQAWRKTVCKNCFQAPEKHTSGGGAQSDSKPVSHGKEKTTDRAPGTNENEQASVGSKPMTSGTEKVNSSQKSAAASIKDKYEQLERDKHKPKVTPPKVAAKNKGPGGLSVMTDKNERLSGVSSAPVTPSTPEARMEKPNIPSTQPKQGRILDIKVSDRDSGEDVKSGKVPVNKLVKSKFGSVDNVSDTEETSKLEVFQKSKSKYGSMENISLQQKKKEPISIPIQKSKFGGSMENVSITDKKQAGKISQNTASDLLNKLDNFSIEIRSGATSNVGSTIIQHQDGGKSDIISIPIKRASAPSTPTTDSPKSWSNKESLQNELNEKRLSKGNDMFNHLNKTATSDKDPKSNVSKSDPAPLPSDKFKKLDLKSTTANKDLKSPTPEKLTKLDAKSPTPDKDNKSDFKTKFEKPELKSKFDQKSQDPHTANEKVDLRAGLKKNNSSVNDNSKTEKTDSRFPTLKSTKKDQSSDKNNDSNSTTSKVQKLNSADVKTDADKNLKSKDNKVEINGTLSDKSLKDDLKAKTIGKNNNKVTDVKTKDEAKPGDSDVVVSKNKFELPKLKSKSDTKETGTKDDVKHSDNTTKKINDDKHKDDKVSKFGSKDDSSVKKHPFLLNKDKTDNEQEKFGTLPRSFKVADKDKPGKLKPANVEDNKTDVKPKFGKLDEKVDLSSKNNKDKFSVDKKVDDKLQTKQPEKQEDKKPAWLKIGKKDDKKDEEKDKLSKPEPKKIESKFKIGKKADEPSELLSKFAKKDDPKKDDSKPKFGKQDPKPDPKQDVKSKFGKQNEGNNELLSRFAKKDEPKPKADKPEDKKPDSKAKFGKQEEKKPELLSRFGKKDEPKTDDRPKAVIGKKEEEKSDVLSKFAKKTEKVTDPPKPKFGKQDEKQDQKSKPGEQKTGKSELLSQFEKKTGVNVDSKDRKETNDKPLLKSKFGKQDEKPELQSALDKKNNKKDTQSNESKTSKPEDNTPSWKTKLANKSNEKKEEKKEEPKNDVKSKWSKPELKPVKTEDTPAPSKLKSTKQTDQDKSDSEQKSENLDHKEAAKTDNNKKSNDTSVKADTKHPDNDFHLNKISGDEKHTSGSKSELKSSHEESKTDPPASLVSVNHFDNISTEGEAILGDDVDACATIVVDDRSPVHVDTQVFTSSRQKTAGVTDQEDLDSYAAASRIGISDLNNSRSLGESEGGIRLQNGDLPKHIQTTDLDAPELPDEIEVGEVKTDSLSKSDLERLKTEIKIMMERCSNLEKENEHLRHGMDKKDSEVKDIKKDKHDVESTIKTLQHKMKLMEEKCSNLEADNDDLSGKLKTQQKDHTDGPPTTQPTQATTEDEVPSNMEDIIEENETLKQEINDLKLEMDEMYDSFRDQEAEEFRELQRELEITAKNCRILQFKLRKMERHSGQLEQDKNHFEEKLRMLQNQFQDRDAVSHIHALEDELRMAKDVSVRLHDELDLMEDKRGKLEEENRHLTELLEQADRKQFRLEMEVDKLRDKIIQMKQEMRQKDDPNGERKLNCSEFLALHRDVI